MKKLNIKQLVQHMSFEDRMRLIFTNYIKRADTQDKEYILTCDEEEFLIEACRSSNQISRLNSVIVLYNLYLSLMIDVRHSTVSFELIIARIEIYLMTTTLVSERGCNVKSRLVKTLNGGVVPEVFLQEAFNKAIGAYKYVKGACFAIDYVFEIAGMELLCEQDRLSLTEAEEVSRNFVKLDGMIGFMKIFRESIALGTVEREDYAEVALYDFLSDKEGSIGLNEDEKKTVKDRVERLMAKEGYPIT